MKIKVSHGTTSKMTEPQDAKRVIVHFGGVSYRVTARVDRNGGGCFLVLNKMRLRSYHGETMKGQEMANGDLIVVRPSASNEIEIR